MIWKHLMSEGIMGIYTYEDKHGSQEQSTGDMDLRNQLMGRGLLSKFADDTMLGGVVNSPEDCPAFQKDLNRLERWTENNCNSTKATKANEIQQRQMRILYLGKSNPVHQHWLGADLLKNSSVKKDLGILVDNKLSISHVHKSTVHPCGQGDQWDIEVPQEEHCQQAKGGDRVPLLSSDEASSGVLGLILGSLKRMRHGALDAGPVEDKKDD
ncbi:hypothetical protein WISP_34820 [Willisornis vidua]|uniref:Rna-directed dna polymerase from mobile element jockey-like n=1 Tax=Willisornis vidua TaxID=1566151 RepID=A0ABQ9DPV3_9PASS|nr:hypothetical protein WISP_34820 [Willisornis vidua]